MYIIKYSGPFGFIKPWTVVRDSETFSQQFLTPSIIEGIEKKLFPELLNEIGMTTHKGNKWGSSNVYSVIKRHKERTDRLELFNREYELEWGRMNVVWERKF